MRHFLAALFLLLPQIILACPTAADLSEGGSEPGAALGNCYELAQFEISSGRGNISVTIYGTQPSDIEFVDPFFEGLSFAGASLAGLGPLTTQPIEVFISPSEYIPDGSEPRPDLPPSQATAQPSIDVGPGNPSTCVIVAFPAPADQYYAFLLAHEFFHCVQFNEFSAQESAPNNDWWVEASAEWFANYTYPNSDSSDAWVADFDLASMSTPITRMSYENVVFFFWLSSSFGPSAVIEFIRGMSPSGAHDDALESAIGDEGLQQFAKDYFDHNITQPGGRSLASVPRVHEEIFWSQDDTVTLTAERNRLYRQRMFFACGQWEVKRRDLEGLITVQEVPDGEWEDLPEEVSSDDGEDVQYRFVGVATGADGFSVEIEAKKKACSVCVAAFEEDSPEACLSGEWRLVSGGMGALLSERLEGIAGLENVDYPELDGTLEFNPDGSFRAITNDDGHLEVRIPDSDDRLIATDDFSFEKVGTWSVNGNQLEQCSAPPSIQIKTETYNTADDVTSTGIFSGFFGPINEITIRRRFTCDQNTLTITEGGFLSPKITWIYGH